MKRVFYTTLVAVLGLQVTLGGCASKPKKEEAKEKAETASLLDPTYDDVRVGMNKQDVLFAWGQPQETFVAGDPRHQNEKWVYYVGLSSQLGKANARAIYFENGFVSGWETAHRPVR